MKGKKKGKKRFTDFDPEEYLKKQNNKSCTKKSQEEKNINNKNEGNQKMKFKNCLENLVYLYPNFSRDLIEDVYNENNQNFSKTKDQLKELDKIENNENVINENKMQIEVEDQPKFPKKNNKKKKYVDINDCSNFEVIKIKKRFIMLKKMRKKKKKKILKRGYK